MIELNALKGWGEMNFPITHALKWCVDIRVKLHIALVVIILCAIEGQNNKIQKKAIRLLYLDESHMIQGILHLTLR